MSTASSSAKALAVIRGSWLVARGSWLVARGSWLVDRTTNNESRTTTYELTMTWGWRAEAAPYGKPGAGAMLSETITLRASVPKIIFINHYFYPADSATGYCQV